MPEKIERILSTRIPTREAEFRLFAYSNSRDDKEHLALVTGEVVGQRGVLTRLHSECFTGDVVGSLRCDCGNQFSLAMQIISREGSGVLIYLRQEGRGIGLWDKLRAYNLQDIGYDTVDANLELGHGADERDYEIAALILQDLNIPSVRLLTNNPSKIDGLKSFGVEIVAREPLQPQMTSENMSYLITKATRMGHMLDLGAAPIIDPTRRTGAAFLPQGYPPHRQRAGRPFVLLAYAQSLDGSVTDTAGKAMQLSGPESSAMTHRLRATHDAILVGIGTVIADNPQLTVRLSEGRDPQPVILDSTLRFPLDAHLLKNPKLSPWIATTERAPARRRRELESAGARIIPLPSTPNGWVHLTPLLECLRAAGITSVMVEGGPRVITGFLTERLVDHLILTVAPVMVGAEVARNPHQPEGWQRTSLSWKDQLQLLVDLLYAAPRIRPGPPSASSWTITAQPSIPSPRISSRSSEIVIASPFHMPIGRMERTMLL